MNSSEEYLDNLLKALLESENKTDPKPDIFQRTIMRRRRRNRQKRIWSNPRRQYLIRR